MLADSVREALRRAYEKAGTQERLQEDTGVAHSQIARLLNGRRSCGGLRVDTLEKLFPEMKIAFFRDELVLPDASPDIFVRRAAKLMATMDEDRKAECLEFIAALSGKSKAEESPPKSKLAG